jgi:hypothetical protein
VSGRKEFISFNLSGDSDPVMVAGFDAKDLPHTTNNQVCEARDFFRKYDGEFHRAFEECVTLEIEIDSVSAEVPGDSLKVHRIPRPDFQRQLHSESRQFAAGSRREIY